MYASAIKIPLKLKFIIMLPIEKPRANAFINKNNNTNIKPITDIPSSHIKNAPPKVKIKVLIKYLKNLFVDCYIVNFYN